MNPIRGVRVKNAITGEVIGFESVDDCGLFFGINGGTIIKKIVQSEKTYTQSLTLLNYVYRGCYQFKYVDDVTPWPGIEIDEWDEVIGDKERTNRKMLVEANKISDLNGADVLHWR